jgi:hypothetical protein
MPCAPLHRIWQQGTQLDQSGSMKPNQKLALAAQSPVSAFQRLIATHGVVRLHAQSDLKDILKRKTMR